MARRLGEWLEPEVTVFCAASMPIRDLELYLPVRRRGPAVLSNRGANGIDGTVSSAFGVAASGRPVVLLIGDVALAHDIGGLLAARRLELELTIVALNNDGGGIFDFLPISERRRRVRDTHRHPPWTRVRACRGALRPRLRAADDDRSVSGPLQASIGSGRTTIIEIRSDRVQNLAPHRRLAEQGLGRDPEGATRAATVAAVSS